MKRWHIFHKWESNWTDHAHTRRGGVLALQIKRCKTCNRAKLRSV